MDRDEYKKRFPYKKAYAPVKKSLVFPRGVKGLVPLQTIYINGSNMCWIFSDEADKQLAMHQMETVNSVLREASGLINVDLGSVESLAFDPDLRDGMEMLGQDGSAGDWNYTRVDYSPITLTGNDCDSPVKLRIETDKCSGALGSHYGVVAYSPDGEVKKVEITYCDSAASGYKTTAGITKLGLVVKKIERWTSVYGEKEVVFKK